DIDALSCHHLGLAIQRKMMIELGDDDVSNHAEARLASRDGLVRRWRLHDLLTGAARELRPHMADDLEHDGLDVEHFVGVLRETGEERRRMQGTRNRHSPADARFLHAANARAMIYLASCVGGWAMPGAAAIRLPPSPVPQAPVRAGRSRSPAFPKNGQNATASIARSELE